MAKQVKRPGKITKSDKCDIDKKLEHLRYLHSLAERYKNSVFARAQVLLAITGGQLAAVIAIVTLVWSKAGNMGFGYWFKILFITTVTIQLIAAVIVLTAILPLSSLKSISRIISKKTEYTKSLDTIWLMSSFNHVIKKERDDFYAIVRNSSLNSMFDDLCMNYYNLSHIVDTRYHRLRTGFQVQMLGLFFVIINTIAIIFL